MSTQTPISTPIPEYQQLPFPENKDFVCPRYIVLIYSKNIKLSENDTLICQYIKHKISIKFIKTVKENEAGMISEFSIVEDKKPTSDFYVVGNEIGLFRQIKRKVEFITVGEIINSY